jgi:alkylated DNA repair dioxygenase AlkB
LLVMSGETQRHYRHALPRTARPVGERINLTFRRVIC